jgi:hypothetical protein
MQQDIDIEALLMKEREQCVIELLRCFVTTDQMPTSRDAVTHNEAVKECIDALIARKDK